MNKIVLGLLFALFLVSCKNEKKIIVSSSFVDSLINNYRTPKAIEINVSEIQFWKKRIQPGVPDISNTSKYAAALISRFHLSGDILDVKIADSLLQKTALDFNGKEAGPYFSLMGHAILQHRFLQADSLLKLTEKIGLKQYDTDAASFDVDFELGRTGNAENHLSKMNYPNDYGYQFRRSKLMHYKGDMDSSIAAMEAAVSVAGQNDLLRLAALSNVGDLYIHAGKMDKAYECYMQCIKANPADLHSIMGIGWIALVKDKNELLAERLFQFVKDRTGSPDALFKLIAVAEQKGDSILELEYAKAFERKASNELCGNMYNKYLILLYTGILHDPVKAERIALRELYNRNTPQTNAWYVWALLNNDKKEEAYMVYQKFVSGKPLEGLELYWMGKLMQALEKGYNANQYFAEANKNVYDLNPKVAKDLEKILD